MGRETEGHLRADPCEGEAPGESRSAPEGLSGTSWKLVRFQGGDETILTPDDPSKYTLEFLADGKLAARIDCNRGTGTWTSEGPNQLELGPLGLTRMACPPSPISDRILKDWSYVRSYVLKDGRLFVSLMADGGIYEFEPPRAGRPAPRHRPCRRWKAPTGS